MAHHERCRKRPECADVAQGARGKEPTTSAEARGGARPNDDFGRGRQGARPKDDFGRGLQGPAERANDFGRGLRGARPNDDFGRSPRAARPNDDFGRGPGRLANRKSDDFGRAEMASLRRSPRQARDGIVEQMLRRRRDTAEARRLALAKKRTLSSVRQPPMNDDR